MVIYFYFVISHIALWVAKWFKINMVIYMAIIMGAYSLVAFNFDPVLQQMNCGGEGVDLYRHFMSLDLIRFGNSDELYIEAPFSALYLYGIATLFDNNHMLPLISTWIFYIIYFYIVISYCKKIGAKYSIVKSVIFISICFMVFFGVMNNIRYPIAMTMFMFVLYNEMLTRQIGKLWYILPVLMHPGIIFLVIIRALAQNKMKYSITIGSIASLMILLDFDNIIQIMISFLSFVPDLQYLIIKTTIKMYSYSSGDEYAVPLLFRATSLYVFFVFVILLMLATNYQSELYKNKLFMRMAKITILVVIVGEVTNYMDGNFSDRIIGVLPFYVSMLCADILVKIQEQAKLTKTAVESFIYINSFAYLSIWLFKVYIDWIYGGL